jgi:tetratricopeptide (TPR) repeat protein
MIKTIHAAAAASLLVATPLFAQDTEEVYTAPSKGSAKAAPAGPAPAGQVRPSNKALKAIAELQTAVNANDVAAIPAKVAAAQAVATTKEDRYLIGQMRLKAALASNDTAALSSAVDAVAASGFLDAAKTAELYTSLGARHFKNKQYSQAAAMFERAATINPSDSKLPLMVADARMAEGRKGEAAAMYDLAIKAREAAGMSADEALYKRAVQAAYDAKLATVGDLSRRWVTAYPSPESWRNTIAIVRNETKPDLEGTIDLLRLMRATGALTRSNDLSLYVRALVDRSNFIEAQGALEQATPGPELDAAGLASLRSTVASKPKVTAAELAAAAKSAQSGAALLRIGDRYYGLGEYAKAAETYRAAKARGAEGSLADLRTGIALAAAGDKAGAAAALNGVSGARAETARMWLLYVQSRG